MQEVFEPGTIVFWVGRRWSSHEPIVRVGIVDQQFAGECAVDYLLHKEDRIIYCADYPDGIGWDDFRQTYKSHKLPKNWSWDTKLYRVEFDNSIHEALMNYPFTADGAKRAYEDGLMVIPSRCRYDHIDDRIDHNGYQIVMTPADPTLEECLYNTTIPTDKLHRDAKSAIAERDAINAEYARQAALSDEEWSIEQIEKQLAKWRLTFLPTQDDFDNVRSRLLALPNIADVETRTTSKGLEWKYFDKRRWNKMEPEVS